MSALNRRILDDINARDSSVAYNDQGKPVLIHDLTGKGEHKDGLRADGGLVLLPLWRKWRKG